MELYYVRDGIINKYALNFEILVPSKVDTLNFCWGSLIEKSVSYSYSWGEYFCICNHKY